MPEYPAARWGRFRINATEYGQRFPYSAVVLASLTGVVARTFGDVVIAVLGAGTGNLLRSFGGERVRGYAVESSGAMRAVAHHLAPHDCRFEWVSGTPESCPLPNNSVNWVLLGNVDRFFDPSRTFREAHRILKENGFLTIIWNIRDLKRDRLQQAMEEMVIRELSCVRRTGSSGAQIMDGVDTEGLFSEYCYAHARHEQKLPPERFLEVWKAGQDIPPSVSESHWDHILSKTARVIFCESSVCTIWRTCAWTFQAI